MKIKKKLRDVTPSEYREWEKKHCALNTIDCANCAFHYVMCRSWGPSWVKHKNLYSDNFLDQEIEIEIKGRHDPIIVPRAVVVVETMAAMTVLDLLLESMTNRMDRIKKFFKEI